MLDLLGATLTSLACLLIGPLRSINGVTNGTAEAKTVCLGELCFILVHLPFSFLFFVLWTVGMTLLNAT